MRQPLGLVALILALSAASGPGCGHSNDGSPSGVPSGKPNFVVILADDMAYGLFGEGRRFPALQLDNLERLAARGVQFDRAAVTTSLCSPSRATLLSGLYAHTHGVGVNEIVELPASIPTYPQILQAAGYQTAFVGKWHMDARTDMPRPGFNYWLSFKGQGVYFDPQLNENGKPLKRAGYITDLLTEYAVNWLRQRASQPQPFLLILSHKAPHQPVQPAPRHAEALAGLALPEPANFEDTFADKPEWQRRYAMCGGQPAAYVSCPDPLPKTLAPMPWSPRDPYRLDYLRTLLALDESVGAVVSALESQGLTGSTYVFFLSDNGLFLGEHRLGDKRIAYEESIRVPFVVAGRDLAARRSSALALNLDLAPTILDLAGAPIPGTMQGRSLGPLLRGESSGPVRDSFLYEYETDSVYPVVPSLFAIRTLGRKYVTYPDRPDDDELYDLATDPSELTNLAERPEWEATRASLRQQLLRLLDQTGGTF
jgi:N-acetylglucosamine-6-sulfatase